MINMAETSKDLLSDADKSNTPWERGRRMTDVFCDFIGRLPRRVLGVLDDCQQRGRREMSDLKKNTVEDKQKSIRKTVLKWLVKRL